MTYLPWFPFFPGDFWGDENVQAMTWEEVGIYLKLLSLQWTEGSIPADQEKLARICRVDGPAMARLWRGLWPCWEKYENDSDRLINPRLRKIAEERTSVHQRLAEQGRAGARARWPGYDSAMAQPKPGYNGAMAKIDKELTTTTDPPRPPFEDGAPQGSAGEETAETANGEETAKPANRDDQTTPQEPQKRTSRKRTTGKQPTPPPDTFEPSKADISWFRNKFGKVSQNRVEIETEKFLETHRSRGNVFVDWHAAWKTWMVNWQTDFGKKSPPSTGPPPGVPDDDPNLMQPDE